jgi:hypothetical protein
VDWKNLLSTPDMVAAVVVVLLLSAGVLAYLVAFTSMAYMGRRLVLATGSKAAALATIRILEADADEQLKRGLEQQPPADFVRGFTRADLDTEADAILNGDEGRKR